MIVYEDMTKEKILSDMLSQAPPDIDTRQGSIYYDAVAGAATIIARTYADLNITAQIIYIDSTGGEYLDKKASEHGMTRNAATKAVYAFSYDGTTPTVGSRFYYDGFYFVLESRNNTLVLVADAAGEASNHIESGTPAIPVNPISGLNTATFGMIQVYGEDIESDDDFRERLRRKISGPTENGNKAHYKAWCEEVDGVGTARIFPLWNGPNTVKAVLITPEGTPASDSVVAAVQEYVDPNGDGLGEGVANIGAHFTAAKAGEYYIHVLLTGVILKSGFTMEQATAEVRTAVAAYLKECNLESKGDSPIRIYVSKITSLVYTLESIDSFSGLSLNSQSASTVTAYETVTADKVAVIGTVELDAES